MSIVESLAMPGPRLIDLEEYFRALLIERAVELEQKMLRSDSECQRCRSLSDSYLEALGDRIPPEAEGTQVFLEALRETFTALESRVIHLAYQQGVWDGVSWVKFQETGGEGRAARF